jgi:hypothetical protein
MSRDDGDQCSSLLPRFVTLDKINHPEGRGKEGKDKTCAGIVVEKNKNELVVFDLE